jgi:phosphoribosyl 1,2-cyclic phosphate phosphodiesterase
MPDVLLVCVKYYNIDDAIAFARRVGARRTLLIHMCHDIGLHEAVNSHLPEDVKLAYDGQIVEF